MYQFYNSYLVRYPNKEDTPAISEMETSSFEFWLVNFLRQWISVAICKRYSPILDCS